MPAYRLSGLVGESIRAVDGVLRAAGYPYEIIVVDDGSPDDTYGEALRASRGRPVRVLRLRRNRGKGAALLAGYRRSRGDIVVFFDADLDIDPRQIPLLVRALHATGADAVVTSKWHPRSRTEASPTRWFLSRAFHALERLLLGVRVTDTQTGAKAFKRQALDEVAPRLTVKRYAFDAELLTAITARGKTIVEIPAVWRIRLKSRFHPLEIARMLLDLLAIAYRHRVKHQYTA